MPHGGSRNGWLFALDDGRRMILTRCAVVDKLESHEFPMDQGVIDAMATVSDQNNRWVNCTFPCRQRPHRDGM